MLAVTLLSLPVVWLLSIAISRPLRMENTIVHDLRERGYLEESDGLLQLTSEGAGEQAALAPLVDNIRQQVTAARPPDDYLTLLRLLARLVAALPEPSR